MATLSEANPSKEESHICGPTDPSSAPKDDNDKLPTASALQTAATQTVLDAAGTPHPLSSLYTDASGDVTQNLVIFIRHFGCSVCQQYLSHLGAALPPSTLAAHGSRITVIGCGDAALIEWYKSESHCPYPLFANPDRSVYKTLGMGRTFAAGEKAPEYVEGMGMVALAWKGLVQMLKQPQNAFKVGDFQQVGGEFLWIKKEGGAEGEWELKWAHRMPNTRGHAEVGEIKQVLGIVG